MMNRKAKGGKREDLDGMYFRSAWEANYARYLNWLVKMGDIKSWKYEGQTFHFPVTRGNMAYIPDFTVYNTDDTVEYHEVKGYMDKDSRVKLRRMAQHYPTVKVVVIDADSYRAIAQTVSRLIGGWEK